MILSWYSCTIPIDFELCSSWSLTIRNENLYCALTQSLHLLTKGYESKEKLMLTEGDKDISFTNCCFIPSPFNLDFTAKKLYLAVLNDITKLCSRDPEIITDIYSAKEQLILNIKHKLFDYKFDLEYNEDIKLDEILKFSGIKISDKQDMSCLSRLEYFIDFTSYFNLHKLLIFLDLKSYFSISELNELVRYAASFNQPILLLDNIKQEECSPIEGTKTIFIDSKFNESLI